MRTIKDLIEVLSTFPEDLPIYIRGTVDNPQPLKPEPFSVDLYPDYNAEAYIVLRGARDNLNAKDDDGRDIKWEA